MNLVAVYHANGTLYLSWNQKSPTAVAFCSFEQGSHTAVVFVDEVNATSCGANQVTVPNILYNSSMNLSCSVSAKSRDGTGQSTTVHVINGSCKSMTKIIAIHVTYLAVAAIPLSVLRQLFSLSLSFHSALPSVKGLELVPLSNTSLLVSWKQPQVPPGLITAYALSWSSLSTEIATKLVSIDDQRFSRRHAIVYDLCT